MIVDGGGGAAVNKELRPAGNRSGNLLNLRMASPSLTAGVL